MGKGTTMVVRLPWLRDARPHESAALPVARLDGVHVLVVDDDPDTLMLVAEVLRTSGAEVDVASSAREALTNVEKLKPDVVVSDVSMPDMDGYALIRKLRELPADRGGGTPALALTAFARSEDAQRAFSAGFQLHAPKPIDPATLTTLVASLARQAPSLA